MKQTWMLFVVVTALAVWLSWTWGLAFFYWPSSVLSGEGEPQASIIRRVMPHHLVKTEWVTPMPNGKLISPWLVAETKARMSIIGVGWLSCVIGLWAWMKWRSKRPAGNRLKEAVALGSAALLATGIFIAIAGLLSPLVIRLQSLMPPGRTNMLVLVVGLTAVISLALVIAFIAGNAMSKNADVQKNPQSPRRTDP
ncbi:MAG: hypothetical protein ACOYOU_03530 [Kiritimatiellia bacterium]